MKRHLQIPLLFTVILFACKKENKDPVETPIPVGTWEQAADFPGQPRFQCVSFVLDGRGYIGTGYGFLDDFYAYHPATDAWTQVASIPVGRGDATGFSLLGKGFVMTGENASSNGMKDVWEYDPVADSWTQKNDFPGLPRYDATSLVIGGKAYMGTGWTEAFGTQTQLSDWWEYDPAADSWMQKNDFPGGPCNLAVGVGVGQKGYFGISGPGPGPGKGWWEYDPISDTWTQKANYPGKPRYDAGIFAIGNRIYVGNGGQGNGIDPANTLLDWWFYDVETDTWAAAANQEKQRYGGAGFAIDGTGYFGLGFGDIEGAQSDFWKFLED